MNHLRLKQTDLPAGKRYVIADIHGCAHTLRALLQKVAPTRADALFFLGDYLHRGPAGREVVDQLIRLQEEGYRVYCLRGNHEEMWYPDDRKMFMAADQQTFLPRYRPFFEGLLHYIELDDAFLVHAGFDFSKPQPFTHTRAMLWSRQNFAERFPNPPKRVIHGHLTKPLAVIQEAVAHRAAWMPLDNGCYKKYRHGYGNLCCLELNTFQLTVQENVDEVEVV